MISIRTLYDVSPTMSREMQQHTLCTENAIYTVYTADFNRFGTFRYSFDEIKEIYIYMCVYVYHPSVKI